MGFCVSWASLQAQRPMGSILILRELGFAPGATPNATPNRSIVNPRGEVANKTEENERRKFIKACPSDGCRGFLNTAYICGLCATHVCPQCHEIKSHRAVIPAATAAAAPNGATGPNGANAVDSGGGSGSTDAVATTVLGEVVVQDHVCNPDVVASVRAIKLDSKPCPKCGSMIHRLHGCAQMYCTVPGCNTAFDWNTLRILANDRIHNPHYYEYLQTLRGNGGAIGRYVKPAGTLIQ